jgi:hypothetical protein
MAILVRPFPVASLGFNGLWPRRAGEPAMRNEAGREAKRFAPFGGVGEPDRPNLLTLG